MNMRLLRMFVLVVALINNFHFTRRDMRLLRINIHGNEWNSTQLKIWAKVFTNHFNVVLDHLLSLEQIIFIWCTRSLKISRNSLINLDQSKSFDRVNHRFLDAVLSVDEFNSYTWIHLLYASSQLWWK